MLLMRDPITRKKSLTVTMLSITFLLTAATIACNLFQIIDNSALVYAALAFHMPYVAVYWQKRVRAGKDGIEFLSDVAG